MTVDTRALTKKIQELEEALKIEKQNLTFSNALIESGNLIIWAVNTEFHLVSNNQNYTDFFLPHMNVEEIVYILDEQEEQKVKTTYFWPHLYQKILDGGKLNLSIKLHINGKDEWKSIFLNPVYDNESRIIAISCVAYDITEKTESRNDLVKSEEKFRNIFESFQDLYFRTDFKGFITMLSPSVKEIMDYDPDELIGKNVTNFYIYTIRIKSLLRQLVKYGAVKNFETSIVDRSGKVIPCICNIRVISIDGKPQYIEGVARDIAELQRANMELQTSKEFAERSLRIKERFLANMSHEIKTPLNGIIGSLHLIEEDDLTSSNKNYFKSLKSSANILMGVLNDLLDLSKIEAGKMELNNTVVPTDRLFEKLRVLYAIEAEQKGIDLTFKVDQDIPKNILADDIKLTQIFSNLISNALKFTPAGGSVKAKLKLKKIKKSGILKLQGSVRDSGIGIEKEDRKRLFKSFAQLDSSPSKSYKGTGLGLFISKKLAKLMRGQIGMKANSTGGSKFWFTFETIETSPISKSKVAVEEVKITNHPEVLVVDDNLINLQIASEILNKAGCHVSSVSSGKAAIKLSQEKLFDIILMDIQMPDMDGIETTMQIKNSSLNSKTPVIAMTAYSMKGDKERFLNAGMDDFIAKPIEPQMILRSVQLWTTEREAPVRVLKSKSSTEDKKVINQKTIQGLIKYGGKDLVLESLGEYNNECQRQIEECKSLKTSKNFDEILVILHTLKGNAGTLGVEKMAFWSEFMEGEIKMKNYHIFDSNLNKLIALHEEFKSELQNL